MNQATDGAGTPTSCTYQRTVGSQCLAGGSVGRAVQGAHAKGFGHTQRRLHPARLERFAVAAPVTGGWGGQVIIVR